MDNIMTMISWSMTAVGIIGTILNSYQKRSGFIFWLISNVFWIVFNIQNTSYAQAAVYAFNSAMCIIGLYKWKKINDTDKQNSVG